MRNHILNTAARLFYKNGIRAVGIDRIIAEADIAKATLYRHFPNKELLVVAYLEDRSMRVLDSMKITVLSAGKSHQDQVLKLFQSLEKQADSVDFRGCAFMLAMAEHEESDLIKKVVRKHKDSVKGIFHSIVLQLNSTTATRVSEQLALLYDGALASILVYRDPVAARNAALIAENVLLTVHASA
ncbi:hypothetical protein B1219_18585 [Pseudomonas ogarae]|uniref:TetR/AcrR family transcriptional regulator n=1 Tax=Pseudomonas ogarae (strain DSM 112162 / CECT 30235 / F113) TaxID=1114970 RepID=UPI0009A3E747|nr:TetR/AcrR family transcriptional regulator [Pseudomonas ogarae]OPG72158.1 hypothetical protein B1219_18585 [Pseudomonas ogarae]